jgi:hypothetical protein
MILRLERKFSIINITKSFIRKIHNLSVAQALKRLQVSLIIINTAINRGINDTMKIFLGFNTDWLFVAS